MNYYLFLESKDRKYHPRDRVDDSPLTADGRAIEPDADPAYCRRFSWAHISEIDEGFVTIPEHRQLADKLVTPSGFHVVSSRLKEVFDSLRCQESLAYLPIQILDEMNQPRAQYWMAYAAKDFDPVDHNRTKFKYWKHQPDQIQEVIEWELDAQRVPQSDLFRADVSATNYWIATQILRDRVEAFDMTGCRFEHIWSG